MFVIFLVYAAPMVASGGIMEYQYEDVDLEALGKSEVGGHRLVGARTGNMTEEAPFVVTINIHGDQIVSHCTGMLITRSYVLTAAHCTNYIPPNGDVGDKERQCVHKGATYGEGVMKKSLRCRYIRSWDDILGGMMKNLEIVSLPQGTVRIGVEDIEDLGAEVETRNIKRCIKHAHSHRTASLAYTIGGYDIALLELDRPVTGGFRPACLPRPHFDDINPGGRLAGYGKYHRRNCQTNQFGRFKFHYCKGGMDSCRHDEAPEDKACRQFYAHNKQGVKRVPADKDEIMIVHKDGEGNPTFCFKRENPENPSFGWCKTQNNFYDVTREGIVQRPGEHTWGYCSRDCHLDSNIVTAGVLRIVDKVEVLDEKLCEERLNLTLQDNFKGYWPRILCVADRYDWNIDIWSTDGRGGYGRVEDPAEYNLYLQRHHYGAKYSPGGYMASPGTCMGDSGGPLYLKTGPGRYVLTGIVSGGRVMGDCGGINNPVHYTRVKFFGSWIQKMLGEESSCDLCWV